MLRRKILADVIGCDVAELRFGREETGKPFLQNHLRHFSLTHTDELIALAVSTRPVGVDIENTDRRFNPRLAKRYFHEQENVILSANDNFNPTFACLWTLKEAYAKATGAGIFASISKLHVDSISPALRITSDQEIDTAGCWRFDDKNTLKHHDDTGDKTPRQANNNSKNNTKSNTKSNTENYTENYTLSVAALHTAVPTSADTNRHSTETVFQRVNADFSLQDLPTTCVARLA